MNRTLSALMALSLVLAMAAELRADAGGAVFGPSAPLNSNAATDSGLDLFVRTATDGSGNWVAVWVSTDSLGGTIGSDEDILTAYSSDDGATWSAPARLNTNAGTDGTAADVAPAVATDGAGTWIAVWESRATIGGIGSDEDILRAVSVDNGVNWSVPAPVNTNATTDSGNDMAPRIATDGATWIVVWSSTDTLGGTVAADLDIFVAASADAGATWSAVAPLNTNAATDAGSDDAPTIVTDGAGVWVAAWESSDTLGGTVGSDFDVLFARSVTGGATWTAPAALNSNAGGDSGADRQVALATDGAGVWVAAWRSTDKLGNTIGDDGDILRAVSETDGATWSAPAALNSNAASDSGDDRRPSIATDGSGRWLAAWESDDTLGGTLGADVDILIARSTDNGVDWGAPEAADSGASADSGDDRNAEVMGNGLQTWIAVWDTDDTLTATIGSDHDLLFVVSTGVCAPVPLAGCRGPTAPGKGVFTVVDKLPNDGDKVTFKWIRGEQTLTADFGSPDTTTDYALCTYDGGGTFVHGIIAPAGGSCAGVPCWRAASTRGWKYSDRDRTPCGIRTIILREGAEGKAKIQVKAEGIAVNSPALPLTLPVTVQLQASNGECWEAQYSAPLISSSTKFRAKPD